MNNAEIPVTLILEGVLLAAGRPLSLEQLAQLFDEYERPDKSTLKAALAEIAINCEGRGFELKEVASGWRFQVLQSLNPWVGRLWEEKPQRYTRALLETLVLVAYRQPTTRGEIEDIRGVSVSSNIMRTLQEREWVRIVGHRDVPGRPAMFATTWQFLDYFNLKSLDELPSLGETRSLDEMASSLEEGVSELPKIAQQVLQGLEPDVEEMVVDSEQDAAAPSLVEMAHQFQEESEKNVARLFSELDDLEDGLKTDFNDLAPRYQEAENDVQSDEAVSVKISYDTSASVNESQSSESQEEES
ncbi:MAG: SMC-Scp complex subunit ScpB [Endozoicomonadaceae bacterium]|nr:SMC-Scp complex subunit ScpB [Endozoicomonadaceae bacterium]